MRLDMIGLVVTDIQKSMDFYSVLGVIPPETWDGPYAEVTLDSGIRLSWNHVDMVKSIDPHYEPPLGQRMQLAFLCSSPPEVDMKHRQFVEMGYKSVKEPWDAFWGQRYAQIEDPDGNIVDVFCPIPNFNFD